MSAADPAHQRRAAALLITNGPEADARFAGMGPAAGGEGIAPTILRALENLTQTLRQAQARPPH